MFINGKRKYKFGFVGTGVVCFLIVTGFSESIGLPQDGENPRRTRPVITIDIEKKSPSPKEEAIRQEEDKGREANNTQGNNLKSFEDLKDPFEGEVKNLPELKDPFERYNRTMYKFNDTLVEYVLSPMAQGYGKMVPETGRVAVKNMLSNAASPASLLSSLAQGEMSDSIAIIGRLLINTTMGIGGMFDVAKSFYGINPVNRDFDQMLGSYGVPTGPYLVLPIFGSSTMRHTWGRMADSLANPTTYFAPVAANLGSSAGGTVNTYSFNPEIKKDLDQSSIDPYESVRYFYYQRRAIHEE